ncbi:MAG: hypothetical protein HC824_12210 [Synechococcales cyanobacterium RM1_1_8]|nr:hypothetical protein [Synechococcales cyanobacterium RM1_1_8]
MLVSATSLFWISNNSMLATPRQARSWKLLSGIFLYLSVDELMSIHEIFIEPVRGALNVSGVFYYAWIIPAIALVSLFFLRFFRFWLSLLTPVRLLFGLAAALFLGGSIGMEMVGGYYVSIAQPDWIYRLIHHGEEFLEMAGISVFLSALVQLVCIKTGQSSIQPAIAFGIKGAD